MRRVAFLTASCMLPGSRDEREDSYEHELEWARIEPACAERGIEIREVVWDDPRLSASDYDAYVVGTTWDYQERSEEFLARLETIAAARPLFNSLPTLRWNLDKRYLADLESRGVTIVPTRFIDRADAANVGAAFEAFEMDRLVVKAQVGACAYRQALVQRGDLLPPAAELPAGAAMIQPYLSSVADEGEYSFLFFDRVYSHCAQKIPQFGDYRVQSVFGGREKTYRPSPEEIATAQAVVDAVEGPLLYARVDLVRLPDGRLAVIELELVEPYLYPEQGPEMGEVFASALVRLLG
jgi:hypothetical protein